jgi:NitT/TauT family transport system ATP-binding protein
VLELRAQPEYGEFVYSIWAELREEVERVRSRDLGEKA